MKRRSFFASLAAIPFLSKLKAPKPEPEPPKIPVVAEPFHEFVYRGEPVYWDYYAPMSTSTSITTATCSYVWVKLDSKGNCIRL